MRKKRYNLRPDRTRTEKCIRQADLIDKKEKVLLTDEWSGYCDNNDHPLFSINVTHSKPWAVCYYCSKLW